MSYNFLSYLCENAVYLILGVLSATLAGTIGCLIWLFLMKGTAKFYVKYAMVIVRTIVACFLIPLLPFGAAQVLEIVMAEKRMIMLTVPLMKFVLVLVLAWTAAVVYVAGGWLSQNGGKRYLCSANRPVSNPMIKEIMDKWKKKLKIKKKVTLYYNREVTSPCVVYNKGYQILIPTYPMTEEELNIALLHELMHLKHGDIILKKVVFFVNIIHALNPVSYWMRNQINQWIEIDCDHACCEWGKEEFSRREYFSCILELKERSKRTEWENPVFGLFGGRNLLDFRHEMLKIIKGEKLIPFRKHVAMVSVSSAVIIMLSFGVVSTGVGCLVEYTLAYAKENNEAVDFKEAKANEFFCSEKVNYLDGNVVDQMESTDFFAEPGEMYVCCLPEQDGGFITVFVGCGNGEYQAGYVTEADKVMYIEGSGETGVHFQTEENSSKQVFIKNSSDKNIPIEFIVHEN